MAMMYRDLRKSLLAENYIVLSNVEARKGSDGRKFYVLDLSTKYMNNHEYSGDLKNHALITGQNR